MTDLLALVRAADPAPPPPAVLLLDDRARADLDAILVTPPRTEPRGARGGALALTGAAVAAAVTAYALVSLPGDGPRRASQVATPALPTAFPRAVSTGSMPGTLPYDPVGAPARAHLLALAERAERQPRHAPGPYEYVRWQGWFLTGHTFPAKPQPVTTYFEEVSENETWIGDDGSGRIHETTRRGPGSEGVPTMPGHGSQRFPPGRLLDTDGFRAPIPAGTDAVRARLRIEPRDGTSAWIDHIASAWLNMPIEPDEAASMLRALADQPDVVYRGGVTDRAGRRGLVFTADTPPGDRHGRSVMVLDVETGLLLAYERVALSPGAVPAGKPVELPATTWYQLLLGSGRTASTDTRP